MTVAEEIAQDAPIERTGTLADLLENDKAMGAVALTVEGRAFHKAADELKEMTKRRMVVLNEYEVLVKATHASLEELHRVHRRIDQIVNELTRS